MRFLFATILLFVSALAHSQEMFLQRFKLANGDSVTINISEVRTAYVNTNGTIRLIYGYPNSVIDTRTDYDDAVNESCGNLVSLLAVQPNGTVRMAFNPQHVYRVYRLSNKTKIQIRETNQIFDTPTLSIMFQHCSGTAGRHPLWISTALLWQTTQSVCTTTMLRSIALRLPTRLLQRTGTRRMVQQRIVCASPGCSSRLSGLVWTQPDLFGTRLEALTGQGARYIRTR